MQLLRSREPKLDDQLRCQSGLILALRHQNTVTYMIIDTVKIYELILVHSILLRSTQKL